MKQLLVFSSLRIFIFDFDFETNTIKLGFNPFSMKW